MKTKTINAVIAKKMREWWESIEDEDLRKRVEKHTVVTGGCIASMLLREKVSDFDVYLQDHSTTLDLTKYYVSKFQANRKSGNGIAAPISVVDEDGRVSIKVKSAGVANEDETGTKYDYFEGRPPEESQAYIGEVMDDPSEIEDAFDEAEGQALRVDESDYRPVFLSTNAITLSGKIQIVIRFIGTPDEIHENYDFVHCTNYWTPETKTVLRQDALESLITRELRYIGSKFPVCSIIRTRKFIARGWTINAGQMVKMIFQSSQLDLNDVKVLEEQLTGVDVAYFHEVIGKLKEKGSDRIEGAYLLEILDRMF
jgi:hypothetical protein